MLEVFGRQPFTREGLFLQSLRAKRRQVSPVRGVGVDRAGGVAVHARFT